MDAARGELGPEAVLISSRPTEPELHDLGTYEVVFGVQQEAAAKPSAPGPAQDRADRADGSVDTSSDRILRELLALRKQLEHLRDNVAEFPAPVVPDGSSAAQASQRDSNKALRFLQDYLFSEGFSPETADEITRAVSDRFPRRSQIGERETNARESFTHELAGALLLEAIDSRLAVAPVLGDAGAKGATVMLVGAPGCGKTATLMKLALQYGLKPRRPTHLLSLDALRIGGWEQMSAFARISSLDFEALQHFSSLEQAVKDRAGKGLTLIDTPGFAPGTEAEADELARVIAALDIDVHLVLPATLSHSSARRTLRNFEKFRPSKLLFTHTDEIEQIGAVLDVSMRAHLPISFVACGQTIPDDIREAEKAALMSKLSSPYRAVSVAA
jgi:flagellar biosynthesis protein FlhF